MYVAVKGGERAISGSYALLDEHRRGAPGIPELSVTQIMAQLRLAVDRVMTEGSLYDPELAALAIKQASGDLVEAIFLLRAFRTTLPRFVDAVPIDTSKMRLWRRISAAFKDLPGGQILGPTYDYTQRLLDFSLLDEDQIPLESGLEENPGTLAGTPSVLELLNHEGLIESASRSAKEEGAPPDLTREPLSFPAGRAARLQNLVRGDEGFLLALGYSTQRGYGSNHPFAGEIRFGAVAVEILPEELGFPIEIGEIEVTECQMINQFAGAGEVLPQFTRGYGLVFGHCERKGMAMALVDRALRAAELGEEKVAPAQAEEFVLAHSDNVEASGFVQHLKLPHYVDFQAELDLLRTLREDKAE